MVLEAMRWGFLVGVRVWAILFTFLIPFFVAGLIKAIVSAFITPDDEDDNE